MAEKDKKYYWLKLKRDFFKRHDIRIIEEMPNGKDYILFYLKLLLESIDHEGNLRFSDSIPYNEQMLSVVTNTNIDIVRSAMKIFIELKMMDILDDQTIFMTEVDKLIGCETKWAEKKRLYREKKDNVLPLSSTCPTTVRQEIEIDIEKDKDKDLEKETEKEEIINKSSIESIFNKTMKELENVIAPITFVTFFRDSLKLLDIKGDRLILSAPRFTVSVIQERFKSVLEEAISKASEGRLNGYELEGT